MVESSVTRKATERWIVLPPSRDKEDWRQAINAAIERSPLLQTSNFILTEHVADAVESGADPDSIAAIISPTCPGDPSLLANLDTRHLEVALKTQHVGDLLQLRPDRVFGPTAFEAGAVEIFPGLSIAPPKTDYVPTPYETALAAALELFGAGRRSTPWSCDLFAYRYPSLDGEPPYTFDLTGRPKFMVFGPYIVMPAGAWHARLKVAFNQAASRYRYRMDWGGEQDFESIDFSPGRAGVFEIELTYHWKDPAPCELRLLVVEGVFDGQMTFMGATISQVE